MLFFKPNEPEYDTLLKQRRENSGFKQNKKDRKLRLKIHNFHYIKTYIKKNNYEYIKSRR